MRARKKFYPYLFLGIIFSVLLIPLLLFINPYENIELLSVSFAPILVFFLVTFMGVFGLFSFLFLSKRRGLLLAAFIVATLLLRFFGFTNLLYLIILLVIAVLLDFALKRT